MKLKITRGSRNAASWATMRDVHDASSSCGEPNITDMAMYHVISMRRASAQQFVLHTVRNERHIGQSKMLRQLLAVVGHMW